MHTLALAIALAAPIPPDRAPEPEPNEVPIGAVVRVPHFRQGRFFHITATGKTYPAGRGKIYLEAIDVVTGEEVLIEPENFLGWYRQNLKEPN